MYTQATRIWGSHEVAVMVQKGRKPKWEMVTCCELLAGMKRPPVMRCDDEHKFGDTFFVG